MIDINQGSTPLTIMPLGSGLEVGRSCIILKYQGKQVMFDCGLHMSQKGHESLPLFDAINPEQIDLILITHFHLDHCAALPYFLKKTNFKGKVYMTSPTRAIYRYQVKDSLDKKTENVQLYTVEDVENSMRRIDM